jgi:site-specific DNA-methyltransferase (cytosine-N4-specific)
MRSVTAPSQQQLLFPLLEMLAEAGGSARVEEVYQRVAERLELPVAVTGATAVVGAAGEVNLFHRSVRWARQKAKLLGLLETPRRGQWKITGRGRRALREALPGVVITVFETEMGVALWASCEDAMRHVERGSVNLIMTSPPYPLLRQKAYGNLAGREYIDWMLRVAAQMRETLADDGSLVLNLADVWNSGEATLSLYQERLLIRLEDELGLKLCQRFAWENPSKLPAPAQWVTIERKRVKPSLEQVYWLSAGEPPADNRRVLKAYSESMRRRLAAGGDAAITRPSGHALSAGAFGTDHGGAIPGNLIIAPNTESNGPYMRACREQGLPIHPARFPGELPRFFIKLLTQPGDVVADFFAGSCKTGEEAEALGCHWIGVERVLEYLQGAAHRFADRPGFRSALTGV